jgi:Ca-activated chloride channel family protein
LLAHLVFLEFNERPYWMLPEELPFTNNINWLDQALDWTPASGKTALYDAVNAAIEHASSGKLENRALIMLSDGGDNASRKTLGDVLRLAQESNATIYTIGLFDPHSAGLPRT